ncbi:hypothetical protein QQ008_10155 [Fulvivirgaceae bacterium BMA10]|uniref:N-acetyltransferase domain-containing protein n=1 Tax=Splendidivirga corallicola TaxID=3051826 RepID=A0ABT8KND9_9BACT|nr:hypothetical protein [Fulvivirgaceae bacterium BMA10]
MKIIEVRGQDTAREFLMLPVHLYKHEEKWIRPLDKDIEAVFDKKKNKFFRNGECTRWILKNREDKTIGRVAAFYDKKTMTKDNDQPTGGMGFFECVDDQNAAFLLFETCKNWLTDKGLEAMDGPINFGNRDKWWGLLVEGFDEEPNYCCNYNFSYYKNFFEGYGFKTYFEQYTYARKTRDPFAPRIAEKAEKIMKTPEYSFEHMQLKRADKYTEDFRTVYNKAWANHSGVPKLSPQQAKNAVKSMKPIMDEKIVWFGYYNNEPVAFFLLLPEVNQIFKHINGKLDAIGKVKFLWHKWRRSCNKMIGLVFGIVPEHQGKGLEGALIMATAKMVQDDYHRYENLEMNWIGDFNPKMIRVVEQVGGHVSKTHITYRKLFDESKPFKRAPIMD